MISTFEAARALMTYRKRNGVDGIGILITDEDVVNLDEDILYEDGTFIVAEASERTLVVAKKTRGNTWHGLFMLKEGIL